MKIMLAFIQSIRAAIMAMMSDSAARSTMVASIVIYAFLYPQPYTPEVVRDIPVAIVDQDGSASSRQLARDIDAADGASVIARVDHFPEAKMLFFQRQVYGIVVIPPNFERDLLHDRASPIAAYGDASYLLIYGTVTRAVTVAAHNLGAEVRQQRLTSAGVDPTVAQAIVNPIEHNSIPLFNPQGGYASYLLPAAFTLILQQTLLMGIGIMHAGKQRLRGMSLVATPVAYILLYCVWITVTQLVLPQVYDFPRIGAWYKLFAIALPFLISATALGFMIAALFPRREQVIFFLIVLGMPFFFVTGFVWPAESIPDVIYRAALLVPSTSAINAFIAVDQMKADVTQIKDTIVFQLGLALVYMLITGFIHRYKSRT